jgi:exonuclease III
MPFSILSWNIEHFRGGAARLARAVEHIKTQKPDVFGLLEIEGADTKALIEGGFPGYDFGITDGAEVQEILVGWRRAAFSQAVFSQKREFKAFNPALRPGALVTLRHGTRLFDLLFLHTDSGRSAKDFGNRHEMFEHIFKLKEKIDEREGGEGRLIVLGDLNTMGLGFPFDRKADERVTEPDEIAGLAEFARRAGMRILGKSHSETWSNASGKMKSNLDHVLASTAVTVKKLAAPDGAQVDVVVRGWVDLAGAARKKFIDELSDHSSLYAEVK